MRLMRIGPISAERPVLLDGDEALDASSVVTDFYRTWWTDGGPERLAAARSERRLPPSGHRGAADRCAGGPTWQKSSASG
jgi:2,4-didehydro-3-deoxy-L-rhamnonate hydrolase